MHTAGGFALPSPTSLDGRKTHKAPEEVKGYYPHFTGKNTEVQWRDLVEATLLMA